MTSGQNSTIAGGSTNTTNISDGTPIPPVIPPTPGGDSAAIGGGTQNRASGNYSAIPGGIGNTAGGKYSFAVGNNNQANGIGSAAMGQNVIISNAANGTFVWGNLDAALTVPERTVSTPNAFIIFPTQEGTVVIGANANVTGDTLYIDGTIGGKFDGINNGQLHMQFHTDANPAKQGYYSVYAP